MSPDRSLAPGEINGRRRRLPQHAQTALDEAAPLVEEGHDLLKALYISLAEGDPRREVVLRLMAHNGRVSTLILRAMLGRAGTGRKD